MLSICLKPAFSTEYSGCESFASQYVILLDSFLGSLELVVSFFPFKSDSYIDGWSGCLHLDLPSFLDDNFTSTYTSGYLALRCTNKLVVLPYFADTLNKHSLQTGLSNSTMIPSFSVLSPKWHQTSDFVPFWELN